MQKLAQDISEKTIDGDSVKPAMGNITVNLQTSNTSRPCMGRSVLAIF